MPHYKLLILLYIYDPGADSCKALFTHRTINVMVAAAQNVEDIYSRGQIKRRDTYNLDNRIIFTSSFFWLIGGIFRLARNWVKHFRLFRINQPFTRQGSSE